MSSTIKRKGKEKNVPLSTKCVRMFGTFDIYSDHTYHDNLKLLKASVETLFTTNKWVMEYYFIPHTETDILHIHFALVLKTQVMLSTMLNWISEGLNIPPTAVSITRMDSLCGALKYFLHQDKESIELGKPMYLDTDMVHNQSDYIYHNYLNSFNDDDISIPQLVYLCLGASCESEVYLHLENTKFCNKYKYLIHTIWEDRFRLKAYLEETELPF